MDKLVREWITTVLDHHPSVLAIAIRQRAKFEGWLKSELAAHAEQQGALAVQVEASFTNVTLNLCRSDITFYYDDKRYDVELKTPNSNWRIPGVLNTTRPITQNIDEIINDGKKLKGSGGVGIIAFVLFPVPTQDRQWIKYLERIATSLSIPLSQIDHSSRLAVSLGGGTVRM